MNMPDSLLPPDELNEIESRFRAATLAPWCVAGTDEDNIIAHHQQEGFCSEHPVLWGEEDCLMGSKQDKQFIAHARTDIPRLVAEVKRCWSILNQQEEANRATGLRGLLQKIGL